MMITRIKIIKLYGLHNYDIFFNEEACVKIIHAPNGFGKTTILKLIKAIIEVDLEEIESVPFESFEISFSPSDEVKVTKNKQVIFYEVASEEGRRSYQVRDRLESQEVLSEWLHKIHMEMPIYLINADRLWLEESNYEECGKASMPTVMAYAKELSERMREALAQSNFCGQELDRSFPTRLLEYIHDPKVKVLTSQEIEEELAELEEKRSVLEGAGLFSAASQSLPDQVDNLDESARKVLTLYIEDSKEKLKVFADLATKINLLCRLINKRFSYKVMEVNMKDGFIFKVPTHEKLKADKLSSGEQNELILMFMLLFKAPSHSLILMDEPEISLHIAWQQSFLEDMEAIAALSHIRMMIATHSPDIINGRWDLTTGLEEEE